MLISGPAQADDITKFVRISRTSCESAWSMPLIAKIRASMSVLRAWSQIEMTCFRYHSPSVESR